MDPEQEKINAYWSEDSDNYDRIIQDELASFRAEAWMKRIREQTGGKTPLSEALVTVNECMTSYSRSHMGEMCYIVVITDGRANVPLEEGVNANDEVLKLAEDMSIPQVKWIIIDASAGFIRFDNAERLAQALGGTYFRLEDLNADRLAESVRAVIR